MRSLANLFGNSPFVPLKGHIDLVKEAVLLIPKVFYAIDHGEKQRLPSLCEEISQKEHLADITKNDIRNQLSNSLFLPIAKEKLLKILTLQDCLADRAEDIARMVTLKDLTILPLFHDLFFSFLDKNIDAFNALYLLITDLHTHFDSTFGGKGAERIKEQVEQIAYFEHEADLLQHSLLEKVYATEGEMSFGTFYLWQRIFERISSLSDLAENLANTVRTTIEK